MVDKPLPVEQMTPDDFIAAREDLNATQSELARFMNFGNARTIRRYEDGDTPISGPASILMQIFLHVPGAYEFAGKMARKREERK
jgi:DNA-binding transcriptional regulator YiaG